MTQSIQDLHVYLRSIREGERTSLSVLASLIAPGASVLDLGCGSGALGQYLRETRQCTTDGLTWSEAEATHARPHYGQVVVADLELCDLLATFAHAHYDAIVCADVLEHLRSPERILDACRTLLKPGGRLLISVPNAGYAGLVAELLQGEFRYREEGLLDRTHLRFFTRRSLARFLGEQRWAVQQIDTIRRELPDSEFKTQFDQFPPAVARYLLATPDALAYQFIGVAQPAAQAITHNQQGTPDDAPAHALFTAQVYADCGAGYVEDDKRSATGVMGQARQTLRFALPQAALTRLRLDLADRPGFVHLHALRLHDAHGALLWQWSASDATLSPLAGTAHQQIVWQAPLPTSSPALLLLTGDDPWFELPISTAQLAGAAQLEVELGWPMSADYLALSSAVLPLQERVHALHAELQHSCAQLTEQLNASQARGQQLETRNHDLEAQASTFKRNATNLGQQLTRLQHDYDQLAAHLKSIENSTVFRATRPLVHAKMRIDRLLGRGSALPASRPPATPTTPPEHPVDVIVPVYRGLADTRLCITSVLAAPIRTPYRLIVINDCSPEPEVTAWLREAASQDSRITLLENDENLGFVGTVNRGMGLSGDNDVLLLNSDTEVANDWLDRIRAAAYGDAHVASVTPLSTNATICSYPRFCQDNSLPPGHTTASLDALCARTNPGVAVDVPTGVGFCMYIRRDCLREVGLFDTENFGKGYGEENDFCQRAQAKGWRNLHLLDTFVLHTGGVSFGASKSPRERAAVATLERLHPRYTRDVQAFVQADPARPYRLALDAARITSTGLPVVLAVLHDRAGGTVRHVHELAEHLASQALFLTLTPAAGSVVLLRMASKAEGFELAFTLPDQWDDLLAMLRNLGVCHVHFHHLLGHTARIYDLPALLGVTYDCTTHDYYSYCTHISMTGTTGQLQPEPAPGQCGCCTPDMPAPLFGNVAQWRSANAKLLTGARHVLAPSHDCAQRIAAFAPAASVLAVPHTDIAPNTVLPQPAPTPLDPARPLKIVVIGALSVIKGADVLEAVALEAAKRDAPLEFHLLGYCYRHLQTQPRARLTVHGEYADEDLPGLLSWLQPDLVWFPAQWPETYSYTLSAVLTAGLPVAVPDIGAFAERVENRPWSWVLTWDQSPADWVSCFEHLHRCHFANATPPQPPQCTPRQTIGWCYERDYLNGLTVTMKDPCATDSPLAPETLARYLPQPNAKVIAKAGMLNTLTWLRSLPLLRSLAHSVPTHWQRRVKNWLTT